MVVIAHAQSNLHSQFLWNATNVVDGVAMFFVMSGMLIYRSAERALAVTGSFLNYFRNRWLRVAPAIYVFAVLLPAILVVVGAMHLRSFASAQMAAWFVGAAILAPNAHPAAFHADYNGHLYTIPAEVSFYILVPLLILLARNIGFTRMLATLAPVAIGASLLAGISTQPHVLRLLDHTCLKLLAYFLVGVFWSRYWDRVSKHWGWLIAATVAYAGLKIGLQGTRVDELLHPVLVAVPLSYVLFWVGYEGPRFFSGITRRVGDLSFGTYIWHVAIINLFIAHHWMSSWWVVPAVVALAWFAASGSWWLVEKRALLRKRVSERQAATGQLIPA